MADGSTYFAPQSEEEESPIIIDAETSRKYYKLEELFNSFFQKGSLSLAKEKSKQEREDKHIKDISFTYGEIVFQLLI